MKLIALLRTLLFYVILSFVLVGYGLLVLCASFILPFKKYYWFVTRWPKIVMALARYTIGIKFQVRGADNISKEHPVIYLVKHQSTYETFFLPWYSPFPVVFVYKKSLERIPIFGWCLASLHNIPINRSNKREAMQQVLRTGSQRIAEGRSPVLFPEGTRVPVGQKGHYKAGGVRLAIHSKTPIVPVAHNAGVFWPKGSFIKYAGIVTFSFGPEIHAQAREANTVLAEVEQWIEQETQDLVQQAQNALHKR
ncbi:lysophospholipid acyltransferase family protein [Brackiella oedipodis]|uniref:lysophospholipid acyltransferase family protein n=1 Tax=Brackiella oedipodis TaxID=124225 RepID=UPI00048CECE0|nr:lysophospholipid acyltransferase family protein [Brackiella oedipodis]